MDDRLSFASGYMEETHAEILRQHGTHGEGLPPRRSQPDESDLPRTQ